MDYLAIRTDQPVEYESHPTDAAQYAKAAFWDSRYMRNPEVFEWYHPYDAFVDIFEMFMDKGDEILNIGCGNSEMSAEMALEGYDWVTNIDHSKVVIEQMKEKYADDLPDMPWYYMDAAKLRFPDNTFDIVLDKGCMDSMLCGNKGRYETGKMLQEIDRVLKPDGAYILISYGTPDLRLDLLEDADIDSPGFLTWDVFVNAIAKPTTDNFTTPDYGDLGSMYYIYVCIKEERKVSLKLQREAKRKKQASKAGRLKKGALLKKS
mmetsp:Transcript_23577/g.35415  ORF Transcript_23577/g.35415 Transcript_23577/m.35415 type:complete len:263 (-) Transcript_23577:182-970(-)